jgi:hypothetical protein
VYDSPHLRLPGVFANACSQAVRGFSSRHASAARLSHVEVDDDTWQSVHVEAMRAGLTVARSIGLLVEAWAASHTD